MLQLRQQNYSIYAFDGPGHGHSSKGPTSLFAFSDLVGSLIQDVQPQLLVSHSFGGIATTYALYNNPSLKIDKYVLLTVPDRFEQRIDTVAQNVGITPKVKSLLIQQLEKETQQKVSSFNVSNFVGQINVQKALILHDKDDKVIPISRSQTVCDNWPQCKLITVEGTGHFRILRTDSVLQQVIDFLK
ncbi:MAG: alpha/beta hydrolase [Bacteroidota bacterium]